MSKKDMPKVPASKIIERGGVIKGGQNPNPSKLEVRPPPPKPIKPNK